MTKNTPLERLINGLFTENPTLVLTLGMCPTLAVTTKVTNGIGMGLSTTAVLMFSNLIISLLRNFIPDRVRIPSYIVVIASLVTIVQFLLQAYVPAVNDALGVYIPLIVVNCIILGRAESFAGKNGPVSSFFDGLGMGLGFTLALTILSAIRQVLGLGITIFILPPGAFLVLSCMVAVQNKIKNYQPPVKETAQEADAGAADDAETGTEPDPAVDAEAGNVSDTIDNADAGNEPETIDNADAGNEPETTNNADAENEPETADNADAKSGSDAGSHGNTDDEPSAKVEKEKQADPEIPEKAKEGEEGEKA